jgi:hypothetical protein
MHPPASFFVALPSSSLEPLRSPHNMLDLEIQCPQPTRSLKRKAIQLNDASDDTSGDRLPRKRQNHSSLPPDNICEWLELLPSPLERSRSDSYIMRDIQGQQYRSSKMPKSRTTPPTTRDVPPYRPLSPQSLPAVTRPHTPIIAPVPTTIGTPVGLESSSQSFTLASQSLLLQNGSFSDSKDDSKKSNRVQSPAYRDELQGHYVYIDSYGNLIPESVRTFAQDLFQKERSSPDLNDEDFFAIREELSELANADEATTRQGFDATKLFPTRRVYKNKIAIGGSVPFDQTALPFTRGLSLPPIVTPKPDLHYGYPRDSFNPIESAVMRHNRLSAFSHPTTATYWPFFAVEFKSGSRGGTRWVAENQNAGTGTHCVNSIGTLLKYTREPGVQRKAIDSLAFSCVADADFGSLWVHWQGLGTDNGPPRFLSSEVDSFSFKKLKDLRQFRACVRNIIEYGINERLAMIKEALGGCLRMIPDWDAEEKMAKVRRRASSQISNEVMVSGGGQESRMKLGG